MHRSPRTPDQRVEAGAPPAPDASAQPAQRFLWLDVLRALAIVDIVAKHTVGMHLLGGMGLPVFLLCTIALGSKRTPQHPWKQNVKRRAARLLIPWVVWSAFYGVVNTFRAWRTGNGRFGDLADPSWSMLWIGTELLLWYLPFAFVAEVLVNTVLRFMDRWHNRRPNLATGCWLVLGMALPTSIALAFGDNAMPSIMRSWFTAALLIPAGIGLGLLLRYHGRTPTACVALIGSGLAMMALHVVADAQGGFGPGALLAYWEWRLGLALLLIGGALCLPFTAPRWALWAASLTFAIYLLHMFVAWPVKRVMERALGELPELPYFFAVYVVTFVLAVLAKRTPWVRRFC